ncbi:hypothetical protein Cme02nite_01200 [Catellatospora methionotrophica]|uniref:Cation/H+ exchanger transmembrane domain-containing protein n=1 Tax=Catellatospora methionotrophica TaxID=121620 RepID=A0A8J3L4S5_9ACTN|nr:cation:proton antiporter [Catellatospora methionotrophica]GIG11788.1 hypothetical protein Cme02nite_01200 [Catellatospora methionotrophica]
MRRLAVLTAFVLAGLGAAAVFDIDAASLPHSAAYHWAAYLLLAIGLYGATYGIDLAQARQDKKIIVSAVTVGVVVKALIIGGVLALAWRDPLFLLLGVAVAQIDPLSVAALMGDDRMSTRARTVLAAWSSFDDPITVILTVYAATIATSFGLGTASAAADGQWPLHYLTDLAGNLGLAALAWLVWRYTRRQPWLQYAVLLACVVVAMFTGWMLAMALIGLFARPPALERLMPRITEAAMYAAAAGLGVLLIGGVDLAAGIALGAVAFLAQALVAWPLTRGMPSADRWHLAAAQQHGITAIILALTLEIQFTGVVAVIAPTILTANLLHMFGNHLLDRRLARPAPTTTDGPSAVETAPMPSQPAAADASQPAGQQQVPDL